MATLERPPRSETDHQISSSIPLVPSKRAQQEISSASTLASTVAGTKIPNIPTASGFKLEVSGTVKSGKHVGREVHQTGLLSPPQSSSPLKGSERRETHEGHRVKKLKGGDKSIVRAGKEALGSVGKKRHSIGSMRKDGTGVKSTSFGSSIPIHGLRTPGSKIDKLKTKLKANFSAGSSSILLELTPPLTPSSTPAHRPKKSTLKLGPLNLNSAGKFVVGAVKDMGTITPGPSSDSNGMSSSPIQGTGFFSSPTPGTFTSSFTPILDSKFQALASLFTASSPPADAPSTPTYILDFSPSHPLLIGRSRRSVLSPISPGRSSFRTVSSRGTGSEFEIGTGSAVPIVRPISIGEVDRDGKKVSFAPLPRGAGHVSRKHVMITWVPAGEDKAGIEQGSTSGEGELRIEVLGQNGCRIRRFPGHSIKATLGSSSTSGEEEKPKRYAVGRTAALRPLGSGANDRQPDVEIDLYSCKVVVAWPGNDLPRLPISPSVIPGATSISKVESKAMTRQRERIALPSSDGTIPLSTLGMSSSPLSSPIKPVRSHLPFDLPSSPLPPSSPPMMCPVDLVEGDLDVDMDAEMDVAVLLGSTPVDAIEKEDGELDEEEEEEDEKSIYSQMTEESEEEESGPVAAASKATESASIRLDPMVKDKDKSASVIQPFDAVVAPTCLEHTKIKKEAQATSAPPQAPSPASSTEEIPPVPQTLDLRALLATTLVFAGSSSTSCPDLVKAVLETQPSMKELASESVWKSWVQQGLVSHPMFGRIDRKGKDSGGKPLLPLYFYTPSLDPDSERAIELGALVRPMRSSQMRGGKAIDWRPVGGRGRR